METKKNKKYDLESKRPLFFGIGMIISLSLTLLAFEWKSEIEPINIMVSSNSPYIDELIDIPSTVDNPPPPPKPKSLEIKVVEDDKIIEEDIPEIDMDTSPDQAVEVFIPEDDLPEDIKVEEAPVNWASEMPSFEGGMNKFYAFMGKNIKYPRRAKQIGIEGRVFVQFIVEKDGSLSDIQVVKGIGAGCDEEALRAMNLVPNFKPGKQGDVRVRVKMIVPINFQLH